MPRWFENNTANTIKGLSTASDIYHRVNNPSIVTSSKVLRKIHANLNFMNPLSSKKIQKLCKRCNRNFSNDFICPSCKNELIAIYDNKLGWRTAYEIERISRKAMLFTREEADEDAD
jgi:transposase-like protein